MGTNAASAEGSYRRRTSHTRQKTAIILSRLRENKSVSRGLGLERICKWDWGINREEEHSGKGQRIEHLAQPGSDLASG